MTIYQRISNPYQGTQASGSIGPGALNAPTPYYAPGEIGCAYNDQSTGRAYVRVKVDSGATSSTGIGHTPAIGELAFWKDRSASIVTNDKAQADTGPTGSVNRVAGIFAVAPTVSPNTNGTDGQPLMYVTDLIIQGLSVNVATTGTPVLGAYATADTTASTARALVTGSATAAPPTQAIGVIRSVTVTGGLVPIDVSLGFIG